MQPFLTEKEYAGIRRCSVRTTERERETGVGCPYVRMGRRIYYRPEDVQQFIAAHVRGSHRGSDKKTHADRMSDTREAVT
jgi:hypothetical protein